MSGIFICYRRGDSAPWAGRLYDALVRDWGPENVFMDIDTIAPGEDFRVAISTTVARSDVVLVVIGPEWVGAQDANGRRRLDDDGDIHRTEVTAALAGEVRVIPVLVGGAHMPKVDELPEPIRDLAFRNAVVLEDRRFGSDVRDLQDALVRFANDLAQRRANEAEAALPAVSVPQAAPPAPAAPEPEVTPPEPEPARPAPGRAKPKSDAAPWTLAAAIGCIVGAVAIVWSTFGVATPLMDNFGESAFLQPSYFGGLLPSLLGGIALAAAGVGGLDRSRRMPMIAAGLALATPLGFSRLAFDAGLSAVGWEYISDENPWFLGAGLLCLAVAGVAAVALVRSRQWQRTSWAPRLLTGWAIGLAAAWVVTLLIPVYSTDVGYNRLFQPDQATTGSWLELLAALSVVAAVLGGLRLLPSSTGGWLVLAAGLTPLITVVTELAYLSSTDDAPAWAWLPVRLVASLAVFGVCVAAFIASNRDSRQ
jgi:TIR domain